MLHAERRIEIARPVTTVYGFLVRDFVDQYPRWSPEVVELAALDGGTLVPGSRLRQVRVDRGRRSETVVRVTALEEPRVLEVTSEHAPSFRIRFDLAASGPAATELCFCFELVRLELYMRPFAPLIRRAVDDGAERVVNNIRELIEAER